MTDTDTATNEYGFDFGCDPNVAPPTPPKRFVWHSIQDLMDMPAPVFLVEKYIVENVTTLMYGAQRSLKSFWALDIGLSITHGQDFHGSACQRGAVAYICGEGLAGIGKRIAAWRQHHGVAKGAAAPFVTLNRAIKLLDIEEIKALIADLRHMEKTHGLKYKLIIIDTLSKSLMGAKEDEEGIGTALAHADLLRVALGANVMIVHHAGKVATAGARGSSRLGCDCDNVFLMERVGSDPGVVLTAEKLKDTEDGWKVEYTSTLVQLDDKPGQSSLVLAGAQDLSADEVTDKEQAEREAQKTAKLDKKAMENRMEIVSHLSVEKSPYSKMEICTLMNKGRGAYYKTIDDAIPLDKTLVIHRKGNVIVWRDDRDRICLEAA